LSYRGRNPIVLLLGKSSKSSPVFSFL